MSVLLSPNAPNHLQATHCVLRMQAGRLRAAINPPGKIAKETTPDSDDVAFLLDEMAAGLEYLIQHNTQGCSFMFERAAICNNNSTYYWLLSRLDELQTELRASRLTRPISIRLTGWLRNLSIAVG